MQKWLNQKMDDLDENLGKIGMHKASLMKITNKQRPFSFLFPDTKFKPKLGSAFNKGVSSVKPSLHRKSHSTLGLVKIKRRSLTDHDLHNSTDSIVSRQQQILLRRSPKDLTNSTPNLFVP